MKIDKSKWERTTLKITKLCSYPAQNDLYGGTTTQAEDQALAEDLASRGQYDPVHVMPIPNAAGLPKGTVLDGWRRANALMAQGEKEIECYIRHDLADASAADVAAEFVQFNFQRRQLSGLARARCITFLVETHGDTGRKQMELLKSQIGKELGIGVRSVNRYLLILEAVAEIQQAYEAGRLGLTDAGKVAQMPEADQREIAIRISDGEPSKQVLADYLRKRGGSMDRVGGAFQVFEKALSRGWGLLNGRVSEIYCHSLTDAGPTLISARSLIDEMLKRIARSRRRRSSKEVA